MGELYKLSEVTKITGISRRALQGYDEVGLLSPVSKTEGGYWLYDEQSVKKLFLIAIFVEVGYSRKKIKSILESEPSVILREYDEVIESLKEKKKKIDGMIRTMESVKTIIEMPQEVLVGMQDIDIKNLYKETSYSESIRDLIDVYGDIPANEFENYSEYTPIINTLGILGDFKGLPCNRRDVQTCVKLLCDKNWELLLSDPEFQKDEEYDYYVSLSGKELIKVKTEALEGLLDSIFENDEIVINTETDKYIKESCKYYIKKNRNKYKF